MNKGNQYNWKDVKVTICGQEINGVTSITVNHFDFMNDQQLLTELKEAEQEEDYEYCALIRDEINRRK